MAADVGGGHSDSGKHIPQKTMEIILRSPRFSRIPVQKLGLSIAMGTPRLLAAVAAATVFCHSWTGCSGFLVAPPVCSTAGSSYRRCASGVVSAFNQHLTSVFPHASTETCSAYGVSPRCQLYPLLGCLHRRLRESNSLINGVCSKSMLCE